jgi:hypothetical protein
MPKSSRDKPGNCQTGVATQGASPEAKEGAKEGAGGEVSPVTPVALSPEENAELAALEEQDDGPRPDAQDQAAPPEQKPSTPPEGQGDGIPEKAPDGTPSAPSTPTVATAPQEVREAAAPAFRQTQEINDKAAQALQAGESKANTGQAVKGSRKAARRTP